MNQINASQMRELAADINLEMTRLRQLKDQIQRVRNEIQTDPARADLFYESLALKLHNFYTGCERIFRLVATDLNGGLPTGQDWHRRLLERMSTERDGRLAVICLETAHGLQEYLGFRHVVRNVYGFELDPERLTRLLDNYPTMWSQVEADINAFLQWLRTIALSLESDQD